MRTLSTELYSGFSLPKAISRIKSLEFEYLWFSCLKNTCLQVLATDETE